MAGGNEAQRSDRVEWNCQKIRRMKVNAMFWQVETVTALRFVLAYVTLVLQLFS
ncbi:MAG: hypothetical protein LBC02_03690 [Planctomycetaceae bacterium]|nr:hypothetical protein [Planctomycetaceae bacterium]